MARPATLPFGHQDRQSGLRSLHVPLGSRNDGQSPGIHAPTRVYLHREAIDFRIGINGLAILVEQAMHLDPFGRSVFAFCNRRRDRIRLLFYDRSGFWLLMKRLEADRFAWPRGQQQAVVRLSTEQLHWLLDGIDIEAVRRNPARQYLSVG